METTIRHKLLVDGDPMALEHLSSWLVPLDWVPRGRESGTTRPSCSAVRGLAVYEHFKEIKSGAESIDRPQTGHCGEEGRVCSKV